MKAMIRIGPVHLGQASGSTLGGAEKDGGNGVPGRSVAVKEYDVVGHEVGGRHRVGPLRRVPTTLGSERAQG